MLCSVGEEWKTNFLFLFSMFIDTPRVAKRFSLTHDGTQIISVMRDRAQIGRVMRDLLFPQRLTRDIPLKFP